MSIGGRGCAVVFALLLVAACSSGSSEQATVQPPVRPPAFKVQTFLPQASGPEIGAAPTGAGPERVNDASAPSDTPLCGRAAREADDAADTLSPDVVASGNACLATTCFDPLTSTFIGADGYRHVCQ